MPRPSFGEILLEAIDAGLSSLGESSKQAIYFHLENGYNIEKKEIPKRIEDFTQAVERIFGPGATFLEILIMRNLHERTGGTIQLHQSRDSTFLEYVTAAKQSYLETETRKKAWRK